MLRGLFVLLYLLTDCHTTADLIRGDYKFAVLNTCLLCALGVSQVARRFVSSRHRADDQSLSSR